MEKMKARLTELKNRSDRHSVQSNSTVHQLEQELAELNQRSVSVESDLVQCQDELTMMKSRVEHEEELVQDEASQPEINQIQLRLKMFRSLGFDLVADHSKIRARN
jgi:ABC-type transport system involved in cytochrome bd biosynthesis fused ATPase/permease subunit